MLKAKLCFMMCFVGILTNTSGDSMKTKNFKYNSNSNNCRWHSKSSISAGVDDISVSCQTDIMDESFSVSIFGTHHVDQISSLNITCNPNMKTQSIIKENIFAHVTRLRELSIENCKIILWPSATLSGVSNLKNLTVRTRNVDWSDTILELSKDSFQTVKYLEWLDLSLNNIYILPDNIFCSVLNLMYLNISYNHLNDIRVLQFSDILSPISVEDSKSPDAGTNFTTQMPVPTVKACTYNLRTLDLSGNQIPVMPSNGFSLLKFLEQLYISSNNINIVGEGALNGLDKLQVLDMSRNKIVQLPENLFRNCSSTIRIISFQKNSISALSAGLFKNLTHLISLDLSQNQISDVWINNNTFSGLIRLVMFNLSHNRINKLDETLFQDMYTLQVLSLEHNVIEILPPNIFKPLSNLHTLHLSFNKLKRVDAHSLNGLFVMNWINFSHNEIESLHPQALRNCTGLQDFFISHNKLKYVPEVLRGMHTLQTVDLEKNLIEDIRPTDFEGMNNLYGLILSRNHLKYIGNKFFPSLPNLRILRLSGNKINNIEEGSFSKLPKIEAVQLEDNLLPSMTDFFTDINSLLYLNLSNNRITHFDYADIPPSLLWLDIKRNEVREIGNFYDLNSDLLIQTLYISSNNLTILKHNMVPDSLELLFVDNNQIQLVELYTFKNKTNLMEVDLRGNMLSHLDLYSILISEVKGRKVVPKFFLGENPFECDCKMEWLQRAHAIHKEGFYPEIVDLESLYCRMVYEEQLITYDSIFIADSSKFLCEYEEHCFSLCRCCEYGACDCRMSCPYNCTCYNDQAWTTNIVDCSNVSYNHVPTFVPMDATTIYLDGNAIPVLASHSFIGRAYVTTLYLNNSEIEIISNSTFTGMKSVLVLHLEHNKIAALVGHEFIGLENLKELHLEYNKISYIDNATFSVIHNLTTLYLHGNNLHDFSVWDLDNNLQLSGISVSDNQWSCDCTYMVQFYSWYENASARIIDVNNLACTIDIERKTLGPLLKDLNSTNIACNSFTGHISFYASILNNASNLILIISFVSIVFTPFVLLWIIRCRRVRTSVSYTSCFQGCCEKEVPNEEINLDAPCQAYIIYSIKDEPFVKQILLPGLAFKDPAVKLRVHHRDYNPNLISTADFVTNSIERSEKVIMVLSRAFIYGDWSRPEFKSALNGSLMRHRKPLFIIMVGYLTELDFLDPDIKFYLRTNMSVEWGDSVFWEKLKYEFLSSNRNIYKQPFSVQNRTHPRSSINVYSSSAIRPSPYEFSTLNTSTAASSSQDHPSHYATVDLPPKCVNTGQPSVWE
uniref:Protein toll n=1 Tax=Cacopsylla melanoneura TaxID=428564 RepID=A0A8D9ETU7_9HEMI